MTKSKFAILLFLFAVTAARATDDQQKLFAQRAQDEFRRTHAEFLAKTNDAAVTWQFARACFDLADSATDDHQRATLANQGIDASRQLVAHDPKSAPGHYYLAMNLGQLARTKSLGALKLVREMEVEFKTALDLNDHFDFGGAARSLGLLYRDAPGWPTSIGSKRKAKSNLEEAMKIGPNFPENHLSLIETNLKWRDPDLARQELEALDALWPEAQKSFTGETWERDWADWTARREDARKKLAELNEPVKSPRSGR